MMDDRLLWNQTVDGPIEEAFWINSFTPDELQTCQGRHQLVVPENTPSSKLSNFHERRLLMDIVLAPNIFALLRASGPEDFIPLPKGTFGVEFELSCVVRPWNEKIVNLLESLADVKV
jgi:hypothetical protein